MTKQEEIREKMAHQMPSHCEDCQVNTPIKCTGEDLDKPCNYQYFLADNALLYLHSQGVVIKVAYARQLNQEFPVAVEPLIKGVGDAIT